MVRRERRRRERPDHFYILLEGGRRLQRSASCNFSVILEFIWTIPLAILYTCTHSTPNPIVDWVHPKFTFMLSVFKKFLHLPLVGPLQALRPFSCGLWLKPDMAPKSHILLTGFSQCQLLVISAVGKAGPCTSLFSKNTSNLIAMLCFSNH